jgi:hypothetical protein
MSDDKALQRWRGALFEDLQCPLMWKGKEYYEFLKAPNSVTFPICEGCGCVIWEWPHFEEQVPENAVCETCFRSGSA